MPAPDRYIIISAEALAVALGPNGEVFIELQGLEKEAGIIPGTGVMLSLTPVQARAFAIALNNKATESEAESQLH